MKYAYPRLNPASTVSQLTASRLRRLNPLPPGSFSGTTSRSTASAQIHLRPFSRLRGQNQACKAADANGCSIRGFERGCSERTTKKCHCSDHGNYCPLVFSGLCTGNIIKRHWLTDSFAPITLQRWWLQRIRQGYDGVPSQRGPQFATSRPSLLSTCGEIRKPPQSFICS